MTTDGQMYFVSDDGMEHRLLHNNRNGTFDDRALEAGVAFSEDGKTISGMGVDFSDSDRDSSPPSLDKATDLSCRSVTTMSGRRRVVVGEVHAHAGDRLPVFRKRDPASRARSSNVPLRLLWSKSVLHAVI